MIQRLPYNWFHRITLALSALMAVGMLLYLLINYGDLPAQVPSHYNAAGEPNAWGGRGMLWLMSLSALGMVLLMLPIIHFPRAWNVSLPGAVTDRNRGFVYWQVKHFLCGLTLAMVAMFLYFFVCMVRTEPLHGAFLPVILVVFCAGPILWLLLIYLRARRYG